MDINNIKSNGNYRQALEKNTLMQRSKQTKTNKVIIQFNSCLLTCKLNSTEANYKVSMST
jgi:hypothetical protein